MKKKYSKKRGPVRAKKTKYDGIQFASGLEVYMYKALKEAQIVAEYEPTSYTLMEGFEFSGNSFERCGNGKGCLLYTSPSPRDRTRSRMPSSA